ncbi:G-protein coupled receptor Mth2, partial [Lamellibrachia satsuma]
VTESLNSTTPHPINTSKDARTTGEHVRSPPHTSTPHTTTTTTSTATQEASGDNNTTPKRNVTVGDRKRHLMMDTWDEYPTMEDLEADSYYIIHRCSTCKQKCGLRDALRPRYCYCDRACLQLGDCCLDYEASCLSGPTVSRKNYGDILRSRKSPTAKCVNIPQETENQETLMVVSSCGNEIMTTTDNMTLNRCERPFATNEGLVAVIPVIFQDVIYSNKYCAICNNPGENLTDMITAGVAFTCSEYECEVKFDLSNFYYLFQGNHRYTCRLEGECNAALVDPQFDFNYLQTSCQKYRAPILHSPSSTFHSNPHCALCSGFDVYDIKCSTPEDMSCSLRWLCEATFGRMSNFEKMIIPEAADIAEPQINASNWCAGDRMFDHNNMICPLTCPAGHVEGTAVKYNVDEVPVVMSWRNTYSADIGWSVILTLIGNCLSMACLAFTMTTYCMFEEIRSRAGKCVMNLCGALFFAQLSFQVSDAFLSYSEACTTVAVFQHYIWLVVFLWMNVLAFDISCTFADLKPSSNVPNASRLRAFALYAWGLPAVFVGVCLVLDLYTKLPFSYGSKNMCWIVNGRAVLYFFGAPIAAVITANAVLFVRTAVALRRTMSTASRARPPKQQRSTFVIYLRLTSLMGFVWLFGFLANVDGLGFLYYPFILCNTLQGVFICVSFTLTPTVRRLWRDWHNTNRCKDTSETYTTTSEHCNTRL